LRKPGIGEDRNHDGPMKDRRGRETMESGGQGPTVRTPEAM
jgi:hypothetical protein